MLDEEHVGIPLKGPVVLDVSESVSFCRGTGDRDYFGD